MRQFVVVGHDAPTTPEFSLDDLPGAGRLDVLCRSITAALLISHGIREETRVWVVLDDEYTLRIDGESVLRLNPDERSTGALVRTALDQREEAVGQIPVETSPGVNIYSRNFEETLSAAGESGTVVQLHPDGESAMEATVPTDPVFVLSDHHDFTESEQELLAREGDELVSLGPRALHADQAITVAHNWVDTNGYDSW